MHREHQEHPDLVRAEWATFLAQNRWTHFATLTFRFDVSLDLAMKRGRTWTRRLHQRNQERVEWFFVVEQGSLGKAHLHALVDAQNLPDAEVAAAWRDGRAQCRPFDVRRNGIAYVTKDIAGSALYDISRSPRRLTNMVAEPGASFSADHSSSASSTRHGRDLIRVRTP